MENEQNREPLRVKVEWPAGGGPVVPTTFDAAEFLEQTAGAADERLVVDYRNRLTFIADVPGGSSQEHWHHDFDEWWVVLSGTLTWHIWDPAGLYLPEHTRAGTVIYVPRYWRHRIETVGTDRSLRLAVASPEALHIIDGWAPNP